MTRKIGSLLQEIESYRPYQDIPHELDLQGRHVFSAIRRLVDRIERECDEETATDLVKRLFNAAKTNDYRKYERAIEKMKGASKDAENEDTT
jgi:hypothetical protein